jgi:hypothetical protein
VLLPFRSTVTMLIMCRCRRRADTLEGPEAVADLRNEGKRPKDLDLGQISKLRAFLECEHEKFSSCVPPLTIPELGTRSYPGSGWTI